MFLLLVLAFVRSENKGLGLSIPTNNNTANQVETQSTLPSPTSELEQDTYGNIQNSTNTLMYDAVTDSQTTSTNTVNLAVATEVTTVTTVTTAAAASDKVTMTSSATVKIETSPSASSTITAGRPVINSTKSEMSPFCAEFVNSGFALEMNGTQLRKGGIGCSSTPLGLIPEVDKMVSTVITNPQHGATLDGSVANIVTLDNINLEEGFFDDPSSKYYISPSTLDATQNIVQGHQHVTVQFLGNLNEPPAAAEFKFFKGINDVAVDLEKRTLKAEIPSSAWTRNGLFRICTLSGSFGHQSVIAPIFRRGPTDDCIRITVENVKESDEFSKTAASQTTQLNTNTQAFEVTTTTIDKVYSSASVTTDAANTGNLATTTELVIVTKTSAVTDCKTTSTNTVNLAATTKVTTVTTTSEELDTCSTSQDSTNTIIDSVTITDLETVSTNTVNLAVTTKVTTVTTTQTSEELDSCSTVQDSTNTIIDSVTITDSETASTNTVNESFPADSTIVIVTSTGPSADSSTLETVSVVVEESAIPTSSDEVTEKDTQEVANESDIEIDSTDDTSILSNACSYSLLTTVSIVAIIQLF